MPRSSQLISQEQLHLFRPQPSRPRWSTLPEAARVQTLQLLTRMFYEHWTPARDVPAEREATDE
jgi:hypothetical protein